MPRLSRSFLTTAATAALVGSMLLGGGAAWSAWSISSSGTGASAAGSLVTPVVTATRSTTSPTSAIDLSWTASGQLSGATYSVTRNGTTILCTTSPCADSGLAAGTSYSYVVTAKLGSNWVSAVGTASATTDTEAPNATTYAVSAPSPATAGTSVQVTITAKRSDGTTDTGYAGTKSVTLHGAATAASPLGSTPTLPTSASFTDGIATVSATFVSAGSGLELDVTSAAPESLSGSTTLTVRAATPTRLGYTNTSTNKSPTVNCLVGCTATGLGGSGSLKTNVSLLDQYGNKATYTSNVVVTLKAGGTSPQPSPASLTIVAGSSDSSPTTLSESGNWSSDSLTASSTTPALTSVTATISK